MARHPESRRAAYWFDFLTFVPKYTTDPSQPNCVSDASKKRTVNESYFPSEKKVKTSPASEEVAAGSPPMELWCRLYERDVYKYKSAELECNNLSLEALKTKQAQQMEQQQALLAQTRTEHAQQMQQQQDILAQTRAEHQREADGLRKQVAALQRDAAASFQTIAQRNGRILSLEKQQSRIQKNASIEFERRDREHQKRCSEAQTLSQENVDNISKELKAVEALVDANYELATDANARDADDVSDAMAVDSEDVNGAASPAAKSKKVKQVLRELRAEKQRLDQEVTELNGRISQAGTQELDMVDYVDTTDAAEAVSATTVSELEKKLDPRDAKIKQSESDEKTLRESLTSQQRSVAEVEKTSSVFALHCANEPAQSSHEEMDVDKSAVEMVREMESKVKAIDTVLAKLSGDNDASKVSAMHLDNRVREAEKAKPIPAVNGNAYVGAAGFPEYPATPSSMSSTSPTPSTSSDSVETADSTPATSPEAPASSSGSPTPAATHAAQKASGSGIVTNGGKPHRGNAGQPKKKGGPKAKRGISKTSGQKTRSSTTTQMLQTLIETGKLESVAARIPQTEQEQKIYDDCQSGIKCCKRMVKEKQGLIDDANLTIQQANTTIGEASLEAQKAHAELKDWTADLREYEEAVWTMESVFTPESELHNVVAKMSAKLGVDLGLDPTGEAGEDEGGDDGGDEE